MNFLCFLVVSISLAGALPAAACGDDPRLADLPAILAAGQKPEPPLSLTPAAFLRLQPAARAALNRGLLICPGVPVNEAGRPLTRPLKVPFPDLWDKMEIALALGDWDEIAWLRDNFTPEPLPPAAVFSLLAVPSLSPANVERLARELGFQTFTPRDKPRRFFVADVFGALGGRAPGRLGLAETARELAQARAKAEALGRAETFVVYGGPDFKEALRSLRACGLDARPANEMFNH